MLNTFLMYFLFKYDLIEVFKYLFEIVQKSFFQQIIFFFLFILYTIFNIVINNILYIMHKDTNQWFCVFVSPKRNNSMFKKFTNDFNIYARVVFV